MIIYNECFNFIYILANEGFEMRRKPSSLQIAGGVCAVLLLVLLSMIHMGLMFIALAALVLKVGISLGAFSFLRRRKKQEEEPLPEPPPFDPDHASAGRTYLVLVCGSLDTPLEIPVNRPEFVIGRNSNCDYSIENCRSVSRRHVKIQRALETGTITVTDLKSKGGTFINGKRLAANVPSPLQAGDTLLLSNLLFDVQLAHL